MLLNTRAGLTGTRTGEIIDLAPLRRGVRQASQGQSSHERPSQSLWLLAELRWVFTASTLLDGRFIPRLVEPPSVAWCYHSEMDEGNVAAIEKAPIQLNRSDFIFRYTALLFVCVAVSMALLLFLLPEQNSIQFWLRLICLMFALLSAVVFAGLATLTSRRNRLFEEIDRSHPELMARYRYRFKERY